MWEYLLLGGTYINTLVHVCTAYTFGILIGTYVNTCWQHIPFAFLFCFEQIRTFLKKIWEAGGGYKVETLRGMELKAFRMRSAGEQLLNLVI